MKPLYPEIEASAVHDLAVEPPHIVYVEECGNPAGIPVVFLHGGPGSGSKPYHRQFFNPACYRIIVFDQRGAGRSRPRGEITANTTQALIDDMELIRQTLNIDRWLLFGGSWGATLALIYAETHPERLLGLVVRGTFLARRKDLDWFCKSGVNRLFPDYWEEFINAIPAEERGDLVKGYYRGIHSEHQAQRIKAAKAWSQWAGRIVTHTLPPEEAKQDEEDIDKVLAETSIELHYAAKGYFLDDNQVLNNIGLVPEVPVSIIHGRRDLTCTLDSSWELHRALPHSQLLIIRDAGHLAGEPAMIDALVSATDHMAELLHAKNPQISD